MNRGIKNILKDLPKIDFLKIQEILSERSPHIAINEDSVLSLKQAIAVYEWYAKNIGSFNDQKSAQEKFKHIPVRPDTPKPARKTKKQRNELKASVAMSMEAKERARRSSPYFVSKESIKFLKPGETNDPLPGAYRVSKRNRLSSKAAIRATQERILLESQMKERGEKAHIIYIPAGGQNKKW